MPESTQPGAVFLSYAREDADAARRIADALRSQGIEVWFDESELRGGDAWDQKIRRQIDTCAVFVPIISQRTQERTKGYFRLEWKLAVEQMHLRLEGVPYLAPAVIDATTESAAAVPAEFLRVQWIRLPGALPTPQFVEQVRRLLSPPARSTGPARGSAADTRLPAKSASGWPRASILIAAAAVVVAGLLAAHPWKRLNATPSASTAANPSAAGAADSKSIAVLPFENLSAEKDGEFFVDGLHDEVITDLAKIHDLKVISRTSVLAYRDPGKRNLRQIAADLGVGTVLEGTVARIGNRVRINAQLIDARTDTHLWADIFDGDGSDLFGLQSRISEAIAGQLQAKLTSDEKAFIERRPTEDPEAYALYQHARQMDQEMGFAPSRESYERVVSVLERAVARDPRFALAWSELCAEECWMYWHGYADPSPERRARAEAALRAAEREAPEAPETHVARGLFAYACQNDWEGALREYSLAAPNLPNNAGLDDHIGLACRRLNRWSEALAHMERSVTLDPRNLAPVETWVQMCDEVRRYATARELAQRYSAVYPESGPLRYLLAISNYELSGDHGSFVAALDSGSLPSDDPRGFRGLKWRLGVALERGDFVGAERIAADPRMPTSGSTFLFFEGEVPEIPSFDRTFAAWLLGKKDEARVRSAEAIAYYRNQVWTERQAPWARILCALAEALGGHAEEALRDGNSALQEAARLDPSQSCGFQALLGRICVINGDNEKALSFLRSALAQFGSDHVGPRQIRSDPIWSRLASDPSFDQILGTAKSL